MAGILPVHAERTSSRRRVGANDKLVIGLVGCGGMGAVDMGKLMEKPEVQVAALCDVDKNRMPNDIKSVTAKYGKAPDLYGDYRKMLERCGSRQRRLLREADLPRHHRSQVDGRRRQAL